MDALMQSLANIPWYGWVAIVAIVSGVVLKIATAKKTG